MDVKKAQKIIKQSQICTDRVKKIRDETLKKKADLEASLNRLEGEFCESLVAHKLDEISSGEFDSIREQIREIELELKEIPALLIGLDSRQKAELQRRYNPIAVIRDEQERKQQAEKFLRLQEQVLERASSTRERGSEPFKRLVEKYKQLSRTLNKEDSAGDFLRRQSL